ncbi:MAG: Crp/Fnr family transcriptional regulator [Alphaproteobacteria bacterium]|nr:MAG: Crp/Fnr family transcriptional regulator [Alphaproteobacteria bacterium]
MPSAQTRNRLLASLSPKDFELLQAKLEPIELPVRFALERPATPIEHVYFPESGIASVVAVQSHNTPVEVGLIGSEGMTGLPVLLGDEQTPNNTYMQVSGHGLRIASDALRKAVAKNASIQNTLLRFVQSFLVQTSHTAIANARARLDERLARWILMAHDRTGTATIPLTHEFLALMLGVRRAGVTETLQALVKKGSIKSARGEVTVLDRAGLEQIASNCYGGPEAEYRRLFRRARARN